ncbi:MAG TPA: prephenate dehydrogenase/arogenate dehydrogenase family protein [Gemmatimonadaceae bacterium]|nr:prephenate dehydrogenase/arogenate dehydrogenase family protein [Gemmatimonadaceae bacterium]
MTPVRLTIIGLGVIGGSVARALRDDRHHDLLGWADRADDRAAATGAGIRVAPDLAGAIAHARGGAVLLAVPLDGVAALAGAIVDASPDTLVLHAGSLQRPEALGLAEHLIGRVFGTHPMAGSHGTGFAASRAEIFGGAAVSIEARLGEPGLSVATSLWRAAGAARLERRDAEEHDRLMAWASHLPQLAATAIAAALDARAVAAAAGGPGLRDATRLAQSSFALWRPILRGAPAETRIALLAASDALREVEAEIARGDWDAVESRWERARSWRAAAESE